MPDASLIRTLCITPGQCLAAIDAPGIYGDRKSGAAVNRRPVTLLAIDAVWSALRSRSACVGAPTC